ncbi:MAG: nicotinate (nicotinamide) nucleotide adenylyltransferase [Bacteroidales bacterium]|nr:nicotinate (nicotinamide) nucleotide adenylyltransferase [Bacteroidales bacterium]
MRIAVFSGSFNPLHIGHLAIMEYLTKEDDYDWVYLVVSPKNPIKDSISADSALDRYNAAVEAVKRHPSLHVWVDDIELTLPPPQYTIRTLDALKEREPENDFTLVVGADNLENIRRWKDSDRIMTEYGMAVYPRKGFDLERIKDRLMEESRDLPSPYKIEILDAPIVDISSTRIREGLAAGEDMSEWMM